MCLVRVNWSTRGLVVNLANAGGIRKPRTLSVGIEGTLTNPLGSYLRLLVSLMTPFLGTYPEEIIQRVHQYVSAIHVNIAYKY